MKLAELAAIMIYDQENMSSRVRARTTYPFFRKGTYHLFGQTIQTTRIRRVGDRPIAHEGVINLLQALAVLYGSDDESRVPTDEGLALMMVIASDFVPEWASDDDGCDLSAVERNLVEGARVLQHNQHNYRIHGLVRGYKVVSPAPPRTPEWREAENWEKFQRTAFGMAFDEYFYGFAGPLYVTSVLWGKKRSAGKVEQPVLTPANWLAHSKFGASAGEVFLRSLAWTRETAREELLPTVGADGLVRSPCLSLRRPFIWIDDRRIVAFSPWPVQEQIRGAIWGRHLAAAKESDQKHGHDRWFGAFGDLFEMRCREVAALAILDGGKTDVTLIDSTLGGNDEVEDIVLLEDGTCVLFSVKASTVPEQLFKGASSRREALDWYERTFFSKKQGSRRGGAFRLLDAKVRKIRAGMVPQIRAHAPIFPVVVTYDRLATDHAVFYKWADERCEAERLLEGSHPVKVIGVELFEELMAAVGNGHSIATIMRGATAGDWRYAGLGYYLAEQVVSSNEELKLRGVHAQFAEIIAQIGANLSDEAEAEAEAVERESVG